MAYRDTFHEIVPGYRINGEAVVFVIKGVKPGGVGAGCKTIELGNIGVAGRNFIEYADAESWPVEESYIPVPDIDLLYSQFELAGLSTVVDGVLVNPTKVGLLEYDDNKMIADSVGGGGRFTFERYGGVAWLRKQNHFQVPTTEFDQFKELALARLTTALEIVGESSNSYIALDGSNSYVDFTGTDTGLLDWDADWSIGITLVDFDVKADGKFITLFKSGSNAIMLRRGGSNHGLYVTGNNGTTKIGANTWYAPNPGGKILFTYDGTTSKRLCYYIGNVDGSYALRANYLVNTANIGGNTPGTEFCIGNRVTSNNVAESLYYFGGLNNMITADEKFAALEDAGVRTVRSLADIGTAMAEITGW